MTITLDNRPEIPLHPLDLTAEPNDNNQAQYCIYRHGPIHHTALVGVPFPRNAYLYRPQSKRFPRAQQLVLFHRRNSTLSERVDLAEFGVRLSCVPLGEEGDAGGEDTSMARIGSAARARRREFDALPFSRTSSYYSARDNTGAPGFLPLPPPQTATTTEELEAPSIPIPISFPSMSGLRMSGGYRTPSWLDEFDPYLETSGPR